MRGWALVWQGYQQPLKDKRQSYGAAIDLFEQALKLDSNDSDALAGEAFAYFIEFANGLGSPEIDLETKIVAQADDEGEVLDLLVQSRRDVRAAAQLMRNLLMKQGFAPKTLVTDKLRSSGAAKTQLGLAARHEQGLRKNNRADNSHLPVRRRERKMQLLNRPGQPNASCPFKPPSTIRSAFNAILFL
jgi:hypothetical protein